MRTLTGKRVGGGEMGSEPLRGVGEEVADGAGMVIGTAPVACGGWP
jgi:hypothetical protein